MRIVDLTAPLYSGMPVYEGDPEVAITRVRTREEHGWELRQLSMGSHTGTHVDAPVHMHEGGATLDAVPLERFCGTATALQGPADSYPTGVGLFFVTDVPGDAVDAIAAANPPFVGGEITLEAEQALLGRGIITYTGLVNLEQLVGKVFEFYGLPLRIKDGDGSPVRAIAILRE